MALNALGLGFILTAKDLASKVFRRVTDKVDSLEKKTSKSMRGMAKGATTAAAGFGVLRVSIASLRALSGIAKNAGDFELGMARVAGISNIATDSVQALELGATALNAAMKTQFSPKEATDGLANFAGAGFNAKAQANALVPALRLAQAGMISVGDSSEAMVSAIKVFGIETEQAGLVTDKLLKIANLTNLQSKDLALALGTVGRGAQAASQNLDEMLISMGLVKNTGVDASVAASSVSSALIFMGKNASKFSDIGVSVTDSEGKFRNFIDVVMDTDAAMAGVSDQAERVALQTELFGKFGLTAFQAVSNQIKTGVETATGEVLKGAAAVQYLRTQLADAEGTAAVFEDKILSTFEGQKNLLRGVGEGLRVALGQPFLQLMKPLIKLLLPLAERFVMFVQSLPPEFKKRLAAVTIGVILLTTAFGGLLVVVGGILAAGPMIASALAPVGIVLGVIAGLVTTTISLFKFFRMAAVANVGGVGQQFTDLWAKIKLFARAVGQLFSRGFVEGDVLESLLTDEMSSLRTFLGFVSQVVGRIRVFFQGIGDGFRTAVLSAKPVWDAFHASIYEIGAALREFFTVIVGEGPAPMADFASAGNLVGKVLGRLATFVLDVVGILIRFGAGVVRGATAVRKFLQPVVDAFSEALATMGAAIGGVLEELGLLGAGASLNESIWGRFGEVVAWIGGVLLIPFMLKMRLLVKGITLTARTLQHLIKFMRAAFGGLRDFGTGIALLFQGRFSEAMKAFGSGFKKIWRGIADFIVDVFGEIKTEINNALDFLGEVAAKIPARFRPDFLTEFAASRAVTPGGSGVVARSALAQARETFGPAVAATVAKTTAGRAVEQKATGDARASAGLASQLTQLAQEIRKANAGGGTTGIANAAFNLYMDGKQLAVRVEKANATRSALAFEGG